MPQRCAVPMCNEKTGGHKFPCDKDLLKKWLTAVRRDNHIPSRHCRVCKKHFTDDDFEFPISAVEEYARPRLKKDAVPSRFPWNEVAYDILYKKNKRTVDRMMERDLLKNKLENIKKSNNEQFLESLPELPDDLLDTNGLPNIDLAKRLTEIDDIDELI
ncbi:unnamed protein product [Danaus chrysippus]|uniref:(African queen) hypothetical protein n=1 Tax=Danaus chrysippus TaxID=151541 RepID=A0A8J2QK27_9NEOP|nr:unnamed protein product [Danaus chrysippus]